jgi:hypothetical protein
MHCSKLALFIHGYVQCDSAQSGKSLQCVQSSMSWTCSSTWIVVSVMPNFVLIIFDARSRTSRVFVVLPVINQFFHNARVDYKTAVTYMKKRSTYNSLQSTLNIYIHDFNQTINFDRVFNHTNIIIWIMVIWLSSFSGQRTVSLIALFQALIGTWVEPKTFLKLAE